MDSGFEEYEDPSPLVAKKGTKFYLIRLPKDVDVNILNGKKFEFSDAESSAHQFMADSKTYTIKSDAALDRCCKTMRPLVQNELTGQRGIGPEFSGVFSVSQTFSFKESEEPVPITAYSKLEQVEGLKVRSMPRGSLTTLSELEANKREMRVIKKNSRTADKSSEAKANRADKKAAVGIVLSQSAESKKTKKRSHSDVEESEGGDPQHDKKNKKEKKAEKKTKADNDDSDADKGQKKKKKSKK